MENPSNENLMRHWSAWPLVNRGITALITIILLAFGFYGLVMMPKDEFPPFTTRMGVIVAVMPGIAPSSTPPTAPSRVISRTVGSRKTFA